MAAPLGLFQPAKGRFPRLWTTLFWRFVQLREDLVIDGFVERITGKWVQESLRGSDKFIDLGCGDMGLSRFLPSGAIYNALDVRVSQFHYDRIRQKPNAVNVLVASITEIPVKANSVSIIVSTQVLEAVAEIDRALSEVRRIAKPGATLICSIGNGFCTKYQRKGLHRTHVHRWNYGSFIALMGSKGFKLLRGEMRGFWIRVPKWLTDTSYHVPLRARREELNTHFLFEFEVLKGNDSSRESRHE